jgi:hypothetical protein
MNEPQDFGHATPIDKVWEEIINGTFLDGFEETRVSHPLPPEVLWRVGLGERKSVDGELKPDSGDADDAPERGV